MSILPAFLLTALIGACTGFGLYRTLAIPDLLFWGPGRSAAVPTMKGRLWHLAYWSWGKDSKARCEAAHVDPALLLTSQTFGSVIAFLALEGVLHLSWVLSAVAALAVLLRLPAYLLKSRAAGRKAAILYELPDTLGPVLEAVKLEGDPIRAIHVGLTYTDPDGPLHKELLRALAETGVSHDLRGALLAFAQRVDHPHVYDLARTLVVAFERRMSPRALEQVKQKLAGLRVDLVEAATQAVPNYQALAGGILFFGYAALLAVFLYTWFGPNVSLLP